LSLWALAHFWRSHRPRRFRRLPWSSLEEALDDHDKVAIREAGFGPATCNPGLDVLGAVIDNRAHPSRREDGALYMREALL
jgi:hypothetical protein